MGKIDSLKRKQRPILQNISKIKFLCVFTFLLGSNSFARISNLESRILKLRLVITKNNDLTNPWVVNKSIACQVVRGLNSTIFNSLGQVVITHIIAT
jgi:hypothetical protein